MDCCCPIKWSRINSHIKNIDILSFSRRAFKKRHPLSAGTCAWIHAVSDEDCANRREPKDFCPPHHLTRRSLIGLPNLNPNSLSKLHIACRSLKITEIPNRRVRAPQMERNKMPRWIGYGSAIPACTIDLCLPLDVDFSRFLSHVFRMTISRM
jgi:hypothetical protein